MKCLNWGLNSGCRNPGGEGEKTKLFVTELFEHKVLVVYLLCKLINMNAQALVFSYMVVLFQLFCQVIMLTPDSSVGGISLKSCPRISLSVNI